MLTPPDKVIISVSLPLSAPLALAFYLRF
uniref:Uncharacterized protein n=1 Tax=Rhizophora mucronata TaxID=61149 RepID=A0A2P2IR78_RHIMU